MASDQTSTESGLKAKRKVPDTLIPPFGLITLERKKHVFDSKREFIQPDIESIKNHLKAWTDSSEMLDENSWIKFATNNRIPLIKPQEYCHGKDYWAAIIASFWCKTQKQV